MPAPEVHDRSECLVQPTQLLFLPAERDILRSPALSLNLSLSLRPVPQSPLAALVFPYWIHGGGTSGHCYLAGL